ncbi:MAG: response regulator [Planctomycetes bacterium]|nr:response regulator [Planctomycetota bacterium]
MKLSTVSVPTEFEPVFENAEKLVRTFFAKLRRAPERGTIDIDGERYILVRAASLSVEFFKTVERLFGSGNEKDAHEFSRNILFDIAHSIGKADAMRFHKQMNLRDPLEMLSAGPVHFAHSGWAFVDILPESSPSPDDDFFIVFDHPYSFEAHAWKEAERKSDLPVCVMNAGYSSGWCEASFGIRLVSAEIQCQARGDCCCRFVMAPPHRIEERIEMYVAESKTCFHKQGVEYEIPNLFARKRSEDALMESETNLRDVIDSASDLIMSATLDGEILLVNKAWRDTLGYSVEETRGLHLLDIICPECQKQFREILTCAQEKANFSNVEANFVARDGSRISVEGSVAFKFEGDKAVLMRCFFRNVTERKWSERMLRRSLQSQLALNELLEISLDPGTLEEQIARALDVILSYPWMRFLPKGAIFLVEDSPEEFVMKASRGLPAQFVGACSRFSIRKCHCFDLESGRQVAYGKYVEECDAFSASKMENQGHYCALIKSGAKVIGMIAIFLDAGHERQHSEELFIETVAHSLSGLIEHKLTEQKAKDSETRMNVAEKMAAIGQLAGGVAHDFNNQLQGIMGLAEILESRLEDPSLRNFASKILQGASRSSDLTNRLLAFAKRGKFLSEPVDLHGILGETVDLLKRCVDKRISIVRRERASPSTTIGDPTQLQNALLNLGLNARDAMPCGGCLTFQTESIHLSEEWCGEQILEMKPGNFIRLDVFDTGIGMDEQTLRHIFEPFFTTKGDGKGTGMGLAAVYGTMKQHGGCVLVASEVNRGTRFSLFFPETDAPAKQKPDTKVIARRVSALRVLVVDDEEVIRLLLSEYLKSLGNIVTTCADGMEALEHFKVKYREIDLVILDMSMPRMNGRDTYLKFREVDPNVKVVFVTGYSAEAEVRNTASEGILGFLQKPFQLAEIGKMLDKLSAVTSYNI